MKKILNAKTLARKEFYYELEGIVLQFHLRSDVKKELATFLELLKKAQEDVESEIKSLGNAKN